MAVRVEGASRAPKKSVLAGLVTKDTPQDYGDDALSSAPNVEQVTLEALSTMCQEMMNLENEIELRNSQTKRLEKQLADLQENRLPKVMEQFQLPEFHFKDARTGIETIIRIKNDIRVQLPTKPKGKAFVPDLEAREPINRWFEANGNGGILKKVFEIPIRHFTNEQILQFCAKAREVDPALDIAVLESIDPQTLKATVKRIREEGKLQLPEAVKVTPIKQAKAFAR